MIGPVLVGIVVVVVWLLLSVAASLVVAAIARAGLREERARGYLVDR